MHQSKLEELTGDIVVMCDAWLKNLDQAKRDLMNETPHPYLGSRSWSKDKVDKIVRDVDDIILTRALQLKSLNLEDAKISQEAEKKAKIVLIELLQHVQETWGKRT